MATSPQKTDQVRSKNRVRQLGEVFTAQKEVKKMVDLAEPNVSQVRTLILEPSCGTCNFLSEILKRKLKTAIQEESGPETTKIAFHRHTLLALSSIYGIDIDKTNILESREILHDTFKETITKHLKIRNLPKSVDKATRTILEANLILTDFLEPNGATLTKWEPEGKTRFIRTEWPLEEIYDTIGPECSKQAKLRPTRPQKTWPATAYWHL